MARTLWPNGSTTIPRVSSEFDAARKNPVTGVIQPHNGIDLVGWTDNVAPVSGTVVFAGYNGGAGNEVRIQGDDGNFYRILHHASLYVRTGQRVAQGQAVGRMGTTGQSTGVHTHFETHLGRLWNYQNPRVFMANANSSTAGGGDGQSPHKPKEWDEMASPEEFRAIIRDELNKRGAVATQAVQNIDFMASQMNGNVATDRPADGQLATAISRVTELLFAVDGRADPRIVDPATGKTVTRALASFLQSRPEAPTSGVEIDVDEEAIVRGVLAGLAANQEALIAAIRELPVDTVAALKAAL